MMKQKLTKTKFIVFLFFLTFLFISCSKNKQTNKSKPGLLLIEKKMDDNITNKYFYDFNNRLIKSEDWEDGELIVTRGYIYHNTGKLKEMYIGNNYSLRLEHSNDNKTITINEIIDGILTRSFDYDSTNYVKTLTGVSESGKTFEMKAHFDKKGNILKHIYKEQGVIDWTIEWGNYDDKKGIPAIFTNVYSLLENTQNNPGKYTIKTSNPEIEFIELYTYQYDAEGYPNKIMISNSYNTVLETFNFRFINPNE